MTVVKSNYAPQINQFYETEEWSTEALLRNLNKYKLVSESIWEPAAGNHKIVNVLKKYKYDVTSSDITTYENQHDFIFDFFEPYDGEKFDWIITNPPYGPGNRQAVKFIELALERSKNVAMLLTAKFDFGKTRRHLFQDSKRFWFKLALLDRLSFFDGKTGTEDHAWYVWHDINPEHVVYPCPHLKWDCKR